VNAAWRRDVVEISHRDPRNHATSVIPLPPAHYGANRQARFQERSCDGADPAVVIP
jgi:hypothetical protein